MGEQDLCLCQPVSCLVWCSGTVLRPNTRHPPSPTHHIQAGLCSHRFTNPLYIYNLIVLLALYGDSDRLTKHMMGTQAAGRKLETYFVLRMPHPGSRCAHTEDRPLPRPTATPSHHMQVAGLCMCHRLSSSGSPPRVMPSSFTAAALLPFRPLSPLHIPAWRPGTTFLSSHPRRLHAHAAHRVPTPRADRPPCRPHTVLKPSCTRLRALLS
jgi:hypothetical protein